MQQGTRRSPLGLFAVAIAFLLPVVFTASTYATFWTPKAAILLVVAAVGLPLLAALVRRRESRPGATAALAFLLVATISTLLAGNRVIAFFGLYNSGTGLLFVLSLVAAWAIGRSLPEGEKVSLESALLAAALVNAAVAVLQVVFDLRSLSLPLYDNRAAGLMGNPVQLGALLAGSVALGGSRLVRRPRVWAAPLALFGIALQLSGSRFALVGAAVAIALMARQWRVRNSALVAGVVVVGLLLGGGLAALVGTASGTSRVQEGTAGGPRERIENWLSARHAVADRPLLGAGPGRYAAATSQYRTERLAREGQPERIFADAHNLAVEYSVTTGLVGFTALAAWLFLATKGAGGVLLAFAGGVLALHLVQPQYVGSTPLAFLAVGAAVPSLRSQLRLPPAGRVVTAALAMAALLAGFTLLRGDFHFDQGRLDFQLSQARAAERLLPEWPEPAGLVARIYTFEGRATRSVAAYRRARDWRERAARRNPTDPALWNDLAELEAGQGWFDLAEQHSRIALRYNPWSVRASAGLGRALLGQGNPRAAVPWLELAISLNPEAPSIRALLTEARRESASTATAGGNENEAGP